MTSFTERVRDLPHLGIGVSTEYGAFRSADALDLEVLEAAHPEFAQFRLLFRAHRDLLEAKDVEGALGHGDLLFRAGGPA